MNVSRIYARTAMCLLALSFSLPLAAQPVVGPNGNYYELVSTTATWDAAKTAAEGMTHLGLPGYLATLTSAEEDAFVATLGAASDAWFGASDLAVEGTWAWVTGETWSYTNWNGGEPNGGTGENCAHYFVGTTWNDTICSISRPYVVEYDAPEFDLALSVVDSPDPVLAGSGADNLTHTFTLSRVAGPAIAPGVTVELVGGLPDGVSVTGSDATVGTFVGTTWTVGDVAADGLVGTLTLTLTVDATATDCTDCISVTGTVYTTSGTDTDTSNDTDIVDPTSIESAASASSGFDTSIMFTNGDDGMVDVTLVCNSGLPLEQTTQISAASGVNFSVTNLDFIAPNTSCTISLSGLDTGYTAAVMANGEDTGEACVFSGTPVTGESAAFTTDRANTCVITATPEPTMVMVDTEVLDVEDPNIDTSFVTTISCDNVSPDTGSVFDTVTIDDTTGAFTANWYAEPGETSDCTVTMVPNSSVVEGDSCTFSFVLGDEEAGCDVAGTVFFEGIPTLSQYGMALMALLMLSVGFVGFRRFI